MRSVSKLDLQRRQSAVLRRMRENEMVYKNVTKRQIECLQAAFDFDGNYDKAAESLFISKSTFVTHLHHIFNDWKVSTIVGAIRKGLLENKIELR